MTEKTKENIVGAIFILFITTGLIVYVLYSKHYYLLALYLLFFGYQFLKYSKWGKKFRRKIKK